MHGDDESALIADEEALEAFASLPAEQQQQQLSDSLKGVLAETACTGVIRYEWRLVRPLLAALMSVQLRSFEAAEQAAVEVGPARPLALSGDETPEAVLQRFSGLLDAFGGAPWTLQRLAEVLLEPRKQYKRLHKLVLALEKLLLVTGELEPHSSPGPRPRLAALAAVNEVPPPPAGAGAGAGAAAGGGVSAGQKRPRQDEPDGGGLLAATLDVRAPPPGSAAAADADAAAAALAPAAAASPAAAPAVEDAATSAAAGVQQDGGGASAGRGGEPLAPVAEPAGSTAASSVAHPAAAPAAAAAAPMDMS